MCFSRGKFVCLKKVASHEKTSAPQQKSCKFSSASCLSLYSLGRRQPSPQLLGETLKSYKIHLFHFASKKTTTEQFQIHLEAWEYTAVTRQAQSEEPLNEDNAEMIPFDK